jgi:hypothetical protein
VPFTASVPVAVDSPLPVAELRALLAARLADHAALRGAVAGATVEVRRVHPRPKRRPPSLLARLEPRPDGGSRVVGTVAPDFGMLLPAVLAFVSFVIGWRARVPILTLLGLAGGLLSWRAFRRSARVEADAIAKELGALLQPRR